MAVQKIINKMSGMLQDLDEGLQERLYGKEADQIAQNTLLIIKIDSIGDYVIFRNFLKSIRTSEKFRNYRITLLGNTWYKDLALAYDNEMVDEFIWSDHSVTRDPKGFNDLVKQIHKKGFEFALCPNYSMSTEDIKLLARSGARYKVCPRGDSLNVNPIEQEKYYKTFTRVIDTGKRTDFEFYRYRDLIREFTGEIPNEKCPQLPVTRKESGYIGICAGAQLEMRRWSEKNFAALIDSLDANKEILLFGSRSDIAIGERIISAASTGARIRNRCGKYTLPELCEAIAQCEKFVTNDTGPYHLAMALNIPTVCISNGNNFHRFTPYPKELGKNSVTVLPDELEKEFMDPQKAVKYQFTVSFVDINGVSVQKVLNAFKQLEQHA